MENKTLRTVTILAIFQQNFVPGKALSPEEFFKNECLNEYGKTYLLEMDSDINNRANVLCDMAKRQGVCETMRRDHENSKIGALTKWIREQYEVAQRREDLEDIKIYKAVLDKLSDILRV